MAAMPLFFHHGQQAQGGAAGALDAALPIGDEVLAHVQVKGKDGLRHALALAQGADVFGRHGAGGGEAACVEFAQGLLVDGADFMQRLHRFVNGRVGFTAVFLGHGGVPLKIFLFRSARPSACRIDPARGGRLF